MQFRPLAIGKRSSLLVFLGLTLGVLVTGCSTETVVHGVNEREANRIIEVLSENDITATKITNATGREVVYDLAVSGSQRIEAIKVLNEHELPRRHDHGYSEIFAGGGLIPTSSEEKAKRLAALEGEIERQLKLIDGVLDVEVQVVSPDESALRTTKEQEPATTASVTLKYWARADGLPPLSASDVQRLVAAGVEKLMPEQVVVVMRPVELGAPESKPRGVAAFSGRLSTKAVSSIFVIAAAVIVLLVIVIILSQWRIRAVRNQLDRLKSEISKARRKPAEALQAAGDAAPPPS